MQETSQSERSKSKVGSSVNSSRVGSTTSFDDELIAFQRRENLIYPLFSEISQIVKVPSFVYFFSQFFSLAQFLISGLWSNSDHFWDQDPKGKSAIRIFQCFIDLGLHGISGNLITYDILIILFVIMIGWHIFIIVYYYYFHQYSKLMLYITQILQMFVLPPIIPFYASHAGNSFSEIAAESMSQTGVSARNAVLFVFFTLATIILFILFAICFSFLCLSPILSQILDASWDPKPIIFMLSLTCYSSFFGPVLDHFAKWVNMIFILASVALTVYTILLLKDFPFHQFWINPAFAGLAVGHIFFELLLIPSCFSYEIPSTIYLIISLVLIVVSVVIAYLLLRRKRQRIIKQLSYSTIGESNITDVDKKAHFETIELKTASDIYSFLRIGLAYNCDLFLDFSFPHYIVENYATQQLVLAVSQMISFFPNELQYLAYCLGMITKLGELSFQDHYLFFQMKKVHLMRQSSLSKEASATIKKMRKQSLDTISAIRGFWKEVGSGHANLDFNALIAVQKTTNKLKGTFQDLTDRFSNNQEMCNEYAMFLVEGAGDYKEALKWKGKAHLLEIGKRLDTDFALRSLVNTYPHYLLDQIIDVNGKFIRSKTESNASASESVSVSASGISSESNTNDDAYFQKLDDFSSNFITESKMRLAVQKSLESASLPGLSASKYTFFLQFVAAVIIFIVILVWVPTVNVNIASIISEVQNMAYVYCHSGYTSFTAAHLLTTHPNFSTFSGLETVMNLSNFPLDQVNTKPHSVLNLTFEHIAFYLMLGANSLESVNQELMSHPKDRLDALDEFLYSNITIYHCYETNITKDANITMSIRSAVFTCFLFLLEAIEQHHSGNDNSTETANLLVNAVYNMGRLSPYLENVLQQLSGIGDDVVDSKKALLLVLEILIPVLFGVIFLVIQIRTIYLLYKKTNKTLSVLRKIKPETIDASLDPIMIGTKDKKINSSASQLRTSNSFSYTVLPIFCVVGILLNAFIIFLTFYMGISEIGDVSTLFTWYYLTSTRIGSIFYTIVSLDYLTYGSNITSQEYLDILNTSYNQIEATHSALLGGNPEIVRLIGFDSTIDSTHFIDSCKDDTTEYYKFYLCLSLDRAINEMQIFLKRLLRSYNLDGENFTLNNRDYTDALILLDYKLAQAMFRFQNSMIDYMTSEFNDVSSIMSSLSIVGIVVSIVVFFLSFVLIRAFDIALKGICQLIRLLPPSSMMKNKSLMEFVIGSSNNDNDSVLTPAQSIVQASSNASISVSLDYTINSVNPAFRNITGLTPDEVLGQPLVILFPFPSGGSSSGSSSAENSSLQVLYDKLGKMKNNETDKISETLTMKCTNDIGKPLHVEVTLIAIKKESGETQSFVLSLKDMAAERQQEISAKNAKRRSEKILQHLLPPLVYENVMKNDDTSTLFVSNAATFISIQIVGLLDCVNSLAPSQLLNVLQKINEAFDETASKYPIVHTLSSQDEMLVACCGLFDYMDQPKEQAQQAVVFALEFNSLIDDLNEQLVVDLQFRIGINHGGPLAGNVLDLKTPTFDLFGEAVLHPAYQLACDGDIGKVQITESVYSLLEQNEYVIEKGKLVNVKGINQPIQIYFVKDIVE